MCNSIILQCVVPAAGPCRRGKANWICWAECAAEQPLWVCQGSDYTSRWTVVCQQQQGDKPQLANIIQLMNLSPLPCANTTTCIIWFISFHLRVVKTAFFNSINLLQREHSVVWHWKWHAYWHTVQALYIMNLFWNLTWDWAPVFGGTGLGWQLFWEN